MTLEEAREKARSLLEAGFVVGVSQFGDAVCRPTDERLEEAARMIMRGELE